MKRSAMLELIGLAMRIELRNESIKEPQLSNILMEGPERILRAMEGEGMKPPEMPSKTFKSANYPWGGMCTMSCVCKDCEPNFPVSKWEPET